MHSRARVQPSLDCRPCGIYVNLPFCLQEPGCTAPC